MEILVTQYFFEAYDDLKSAMLSYKKFGIQYLRLNITSNNYGYYQTQINKIRDVSKEIDCNRSEYFYTLNYCTCNRDGR